MGKAYEKEIRRTQAAQAAAGAPEMLTGPRPRAEVESFVKGFGMSPTATRRMVNEWMADRSRAWSAGWDAHAGEDE
jgi:hypothetical protein